MNDEREPGYDHLLAAQTPLTSDEIAAVLRSINARVNESTWDYCEGCGTYHCGPRCEAILPVE